jgi:hypothetical protein
MFNERLAILSNAKKSLRELIPRSPVVRDEAGVEREWSKTSYDKNESNNKLIAR